MTRMRIEQGHPVHRPQSDADLFMDYIQSYSRNGGHEMRLSNQIKPIGYLKAHASEIVRNLGEE